MLIAERFALQLQRLAQQGLSCGEIALVHQRYAEVVGVRERAPMPIAEGLACHPHGLT